MVFKRLRGNLPRDLPNPFNRQLVGTLALLAYSYVLFWWSWQVVKQERFDARDY